MLAVGSLSGCSLGVTNGSVVVEVRAMESGDQADSYDVTVRGPGEAVVSSREVHVGSSITIDNVPLGWVSVETALCTVEGELSQESPTMRLVMAPDEKNCTSTG